MIMENPSISLKYISWKWVKPSYIYGPEAFLENALKAKKIDKILPNALLQKRPC